MAVRRSGGGGGTVASWLAERVGPSGRVVATDLDTRFLKQLGFDNLEVRTSNIEQDPLGTAEFDLVHTRLVLMHVHNRERAIAHLLDALKPGGHLLIEEPDFSVMRETHPSVPTVDQVMQVVLEAFSAAGADARYGLAVPAMLRRAGATDVVSDGELSLIEFGTPRAEAVALLFENVGTRLVERGLLAAELLAEAVDAVRTPASTVMCSPLILSTRARRKV